jgi:hypothetical protein
MADRCTYSPAAITALNICESTGLNCVPLVDTACSLACNIAAAQASEDFIDCIHDFE